MKSSPLLWYKSYVSLLWLPPFDLPVESLLFLHSKLGLVHRNMNLDNVFISENNGEISVHLTDFEFVRSRSAGPESVGRHQMIVSTQNFQVGNPSYYTPQGTTDDLYALGRIYHFLITGKFHAYNEQNILELGPIRDERTKQFLVCFYCICLTQCSLVCSLLKTALHMTTGGPISNMTATSTFLQLLV